MATADPVGTVIFPSDLTTTESWDANVPYPSPIPIPISDTSNILAELHMYASAMNTPIPVSDNAPSPCSEITDDGLFRTGPAKRALKRSFCSSPTAAAVAATGAAATAAAAAAAAAVPNKKIKLTKAEFSLMTEPVTPTTRSKAPAIRRLSRIPVSAPMSPTCHSLCTEDADEVLSMPPTPVPVEIPFLPALSKEQCARRRAIRRATLKRNRGRKSDGFGGVVKTESVKCESEMVNNGSEPLDKKAARAIRNREAAMKSRVEAKQKMRKLQDENECLSGKVKSLAAENEALTSQLKNLLHHALGVHVAEGQDVKEVFKAFARMTNRV